MSARPIPLARSAFSTLLLVAIAACGPAETGEEVPLGEDASAVTAGFAPQLPGVLFFDSIPGTTTDDKLRAMNAWAATLGSSAPRPAIVFDAKVYNHSVPIQLWSGLALVGGRRTAAREYSTGTVLHYQGAPGTSQLAFVRNNQGYPSDGSPRDITFDSIQFTGHTDVDHVPRNDVGAGGYSGKVLWYFNWHDCGFVGFRTIWWGWGDGTAFTGVTHLMAVGDTAFYIGGSENHFFQDYSFQDNGTAAWMSSGKPFFRSRMSKSSIGRMMFSARSSTYQLSIEGGHNLVVDGTAFDAPDAYPTYGKQVSISGGTGIRITNASFKGAMANPASASGGAAANRAAIHITGGSQIVIDGNNFNISAPIAYVGPNVGQAQVKVGLNGYPGTGSPQLVQSRAGQLISIDPSVAISVSP